MNLQVLSVWCILSGTEAEEVPEVVIIAVFRTPSHDGKQAKGRNREYD